jgi:DNA-binding NarL/FixJ family response regulator
MAGTITLAAVDWDRMLLDGLRAWLAAQPDLSLSATWPTVPDYLSHLDRAGPVADVVLLGLGTGLGTGPGEAGSSAAGVRQLRAAGQSVLLITAAVRAEQLTAALLAGAAGYVTRDRGLAALADAARAVAAGRQLDGPELPAVAGGRTLRLSRQERTVLLAYATGSTLQAAARRAGVTYGTARAYLERVKRKYTAAGRPTYTKLDLAIRLREDLVESGGFPPAQAGP